IREDDAAVRPTDLDAESWANRVIEAVVVQSGRTIVDSALAAVDAGSIEAGGRLGRLLVDSALGGNGRADRLLTVNISIDRPLVAIGAPVGSYYPEVARRLHTRLVIPPNAGVCNAIGAVAGSIAQSVSALITAPKEGLFRVHLPVGNVDFADLERAASHALAEASSLAASKARAAGAAEIECRHHRADKVHRDGSGVQI